MTHKPIKPTADKSAKAEPLPKWRKAPAELIATFEAALPDDPRVERRQMFGYPCAFVDGHMFTGTHQENIVVRLSEADRTAAKVEIGAGIFEPMPGRPMREYVVLPKAVLANRATTKAWLQRGLTYAASLPPKQKKARAASARQRVR